MNDRQINTTRTVLDICLIATVASLWFVPVKVKNISPEEKTASAPVVKQDKDWLVTEADYAKLPVNTAGRYTYVQSRINARDQFLVDTQEGRVWQLYADKSGAPSLSEMPRTDLK